jgi:hypothetical protein
VETAERNGVWCELVPAMSAQQTPRGVETAERNGVWCEKPEGTCVAAGVSGGNG